jgi:hypothetical protein
LNYSAIDHPRLVLNHSFDQLFDFIDNERFIPDFLLLKRHIFLFHLFIHFMSVNQALQIRYYIVRLLLHGADHSLIVGNIGWSNKEACPCIHLIEGARSVKTVVYETFIPFV